MADAETALAAFDSHAAARLGAQSPALGPMNAVLLRTESAASSQIEDLTVGARQLALAVLDESRSGNARAVVANVRTMEAALRLAAELDLEAILAMHEELLEGTVDAGRLRRQLVWVGRSGLSPLGPSMSRRRRRTFPHRCRTSSSSSPATICPFSSTPRSPTRSSRPSVPSPKATDARDARWCTRC